VNDNKVGGHSDQSFVNDDGSPSSGSSPVLLLLPATPMTASGASQAAGNKGAECYSSNMCKQASKQEAYAFNSTDELSMLEEHVHQRASLMASET
jgi:hypothetical protein